MAPHAGDPHQSGAIALLEDFMRKKDSRSTRFSRREALGLLGVGAGVGLTAWWEGTGLLAAPWQAAAARGQAMSFPKGAIIRTILEDLPPDALGTGPGLIHDHVHMTNPFPFVKPCTPESNLTPPSCVPAPGAPSEEFSLAWLDEDTDAVVEELKAAAQKGLSLIVSGGTHDMGQSPAQVRRVAERVAPFGLHIVLADAMHSQPRYPPDVATKTDSQLADEFVRAAIAERWGALGELGSSLEMHPDERKVFRAIAKVHARIGLPIFTHTPHQGCPNCAFEQLDLLLSQGVDPGKLCIGHLSRIRDDPRAETHKAVAKRGAYVGFDTGLTDSRTEEYVRMILSLIEAGYEDKVLFADDGTGKAARVRNGGPGYGRVWTVFVPKLRQAGVKEPTIHKMLVENPRRWLAFVPKRSA
jgi:phosphotriesterase-related protein